VWLILIGIIYIAPILLNNLSFRDTLFLSSQKQVLHMHTLFLLTYVNTHTHIHKIYFPYITSRLQKINSPIILTDIEMHLDI
jgi:hypothetical protein